MRRTRPVLLERDLCCGGLKVRSAGRKQEAFLALARSFSCTEIFGQCVEVTWSHERGYRVLDTGSSETDPETVTDEGKRARGRAAVPSTGGKKGMSKQIQVIDLDFKRLETYPETFRRSERGSPPRIARIRGRTQRGGPKPPAVAHTQRTSTAETTDACHNAPRRSFQIHPHTCLDISYEAPLTNTGSRLSSASSMFDNEGDSR